MTKEEVLNKAAKAVTHDRAETYGDAQKNLDLVAKLWSAYLDTDVDRVYVARDAAAMMILAKIARIATGKPHEDNWVDIAGYAAIGGELDEK